MTANDTNTEDDRQKIQLEISELINEISDMGTRVEFNEMDVLNMGGKKTFQIGANSTQGIEFDFDQVKVVDKVINSFTNLKAAYNDGVSKNTWKDNTALLDAEVDCALKNVTEARGRIGAVINRLEYTNRSLKVSSENLSSAESRIRDADMGKEMMQLTKSNILQQAGVSMLAQANQSPQSVLQLLQ